MGWANRVSLLAVLACATTALTACGPRTSGAAVGMTVDKSGNPVIVLQNCAADIVQLELSGPSTQVFYANDEPAPSVTEIPLLTGTADWPATQPVPKPDATTKFVVRAWAEDHKYLGRRTEFTLADLKALKPGQVRHDWRPRDDPPSYGASPGTPQYRITTLEDFTADTCP